MNHAHWNRLSRVLAMLLIFTILAGILPTRALAAGRQSLLSTADSDSSEEPGTPSDGGGTGGTDEGGGTGGSGETEGDGTGGTEGGGTDEGGGVDPAPEQVTINVTLTGSGTGTVRLNGTEQTSVTVDKGTTVTVLVTPDTNCSIKTVNGVAAEDGTSYSAEIIAETDATISVEIVQLRTVTVTIQPDPASGEIGGTVTLGDEDVSSVTVEDGGTVKVVATPSTGYHIASVAAVTADGSTEQTVSDPTGYEDTLTVSQNTVIEVTFEKVYTVTVYWNGTSGTVTTDPAGTPITDGLEVVVTSDVGVKVIATATKEGYRISGVEIDGVAIDSVDIEKPDGTTETVTFDTGNIETYERPLDAGEDHTVTVTFAPKQYAITATAGDNGTVTVTGEGEGEGDPPLSKAEYGQNVVAHFTPVNGYTVASVTVNGSEVACAGDTFCYKIENVTAEVSVAVTFCPLSPAQEGHVAYGFDGALRTVEGKTYVFAGDGAATLSTQAAGDPPTAVPDALRIVLLDGQELEFTAQNPGEAAQAEFHEDAVIQALWVRYQANGEWGPNWRQVPGLSADAPLTLVFDDALPEITLFQAETTDGEELYTEEKDGETVYFSHKDVKITVQVRDIETYSGIGKLEYYVTADGVETARETLYEYVPAVTPDTPPEEGPDTPPEEDPVTPPEDPVTPPENPVTPPAEEPEILEGMPKSFPLEAQAHNADNILHIEVTDRAGNVTTASYPLVINTDAPTVAIVADQNLVDGTDYYKSRTATVTITDRDSCFETSKLNEIFTITAKNAQGKDLTLNKAQEPTITWEGKTATLTFKADARYTLKVKYTNKAGLSNGEANNGFAAVTGAHATEFTIDTLAPTGKISVNNGPENGWGGLLEALTFSVFRNTPITVTATGEDIASGVTITYYKSGGDTLLSEPELDARYDAREFKSESVTIPAEKANEKCVVYARITDEAGHRTYVSTEGIIYDTVAGKITLEAREDPNENGFYNGSQETVTFDVFAAENDCGGETAEGVRSGIREIYYTVSWVSCDGEVKTEKKNLYTFKGEKPAYDELAETVKRDFTITLKDYEADEVQVKVTAVDMAGNEFTATKSFGVSLAPPKVSLIFGEAPAAVKVHENRGYFRTARTATLIYEGCGFDEAAATTSVQATLIDSKKESIQPKDDQGKLLPLYTIGEWKKEGYKYTAQLTFSAEGNYTLKLEYTDKAGNKLDAGTVKTENSVTPYQFTIDKGVPSGKIRFMDKTWEDLKKELLFSWGTKTVEVTAEGTDAISPVTLEYLQTGETDPIDGAKLEALYQEGHFKSYPSEELESVTIDPQALFVIYLRVTDYAGNYCYLCSDGHIIDSVAPTVTVSAPNPGESGIFTGKEVVVSAWASDSSPSSGLKSVTYQITKDGRETTGSGHLMPVLSAPEAAEFKDLKDFTSGTIGVDTSRNNSSKVVVSVTATDNAGNSSYQSISLDIDVTAPEIAITYDNNEDNGGNGYFKAQRTATVVITERSNHFDADAATAGIEITAVDGKGQPVKDAYTISEWKTEAGHAADDATHTAKIHFAKDANYTLKMAYADKAGNKNSGIDTKNSVAPFAFTVDTTAPTGSVTATSGEGRVEEWNTLADRLSFGFWSKSGIDVTSTWADETSPIEKTEYYRQTFDAERPEEAVAPLTEGELDRITGWRPIEDARVTANVQCVIYVRITDKAGNRAYLSTDGLIVDDTSPVTESIAPEISIDPPKPVNELYSGDVNVDITVIDPVEGGTHSGLRTVSYRVLNLGEETQSGTLYAFSMEDPAQSDLVQKWTGSIVVESAKNNSNDVTVEIYAEDNAQNGSTSTAPLKIDITPPAVEISYNNNAAESGTYFRQDRTASIVVTERNFDLEGMELTITNTGGAVPMLSQWRMTEGSGNLDDTRWTATLTYHADGDYRFDIACKDLAGNDCAGAEYGGSTAGQEFTIDETAPVIQVTYDNEDARNRNYYQAERTATISITEHNFAAERANVAITATDNGAAVATPSISGWSGSGDLHTATVTFSDDALYTLEISCSDMAGNVSEEFPRESFYIDTTPPEVEMTGVENMSANRGEVIPVVSYTDTNLDTGAVEITLVGANRGSVALDGKYAPIHNGQSFTFSDFEKEKEVDDVYVLTAALEDKAGNRTEESISFSVNRFGSTYVLDPTVKEINGKYIKQPRDVILTETNADALRDIKITVFKNNETITLTPDVDYRVDTAGGNGLWYQYSYTIFAKNFAADGVYGLTIHSEDAAGNVAENTLDTKNTGVTFGVDSTSPTIVVTNLESGRTYPLESMTVEFSTRDNLQMDSLSVYLDDYDKPHISCTAEEIARTMEANEPFTFEIPGSSTQAHRVKIVCRDAAGNETVEEITDFYVTTDLLVRFYTNKPLFFGTIGGAAALAGLGVFAAVRKRKPSRKEQEKQEEKV